MSETVKKAESGAPPSLTRPSFTGGKYDSDLLGDAIPLLVHESQSLHSGETPWQLTASGEVPSWEREPPESEAPLISEDHTGVLSSGDAILSTLEYVDTETSGLNFAGRTNVGETSTSGPLPPIDISGTLASGTISMTQVNIPPTQLNTSSAHAGSNALSMDQTTSMLGGNRPKFQVKPENCLCCHCKDILIEPMQTQCGHLMCKACVEYLLSTEGDPATCPLSTEDDPCDLITKQDDAAIHLDYVALRELKKLKVYCTNEVNGCKEIVAWGKLKEHEGICKYMFIPCSNADRGCGGHVMKKDMETHTTQFCQYRIILCPYCPETLYAAQMQKHLEQDCLEAEIECPFKCEQKPLYRRQLPEHVHVCKRRPVSCHYAPMGCEVTGSLAEIQLHQAKDVEYHLNLLSGLYSETSLECTKLKRQVAELSRDGEHIREQLEWCQSEIEKHKIQHQEKDRINDHLKKMVIENMEKVKLAEAQIQSLGEVQSSLEVEVNELRSKMREREEFLVATGGEDVSSGSLAQVERQLALLDVQIADINLRCDNGNADGTLLWKITNFESLKCSAVTEETVSIVSPPFFTSRFGYKMCARLYPNGDGIGKGTHLSLFFVIMKGEYDAVLPWPFTKKVTLMLLDQRRGCNHITNSFIPDKTSSSFQRPTTEMNIASGCPLFVEFSELERWESPYLADDTLYIKVIVDTHNLPVVH